MKAGGNAVDAAVAVGYAMAVVYPAAGNLGGGGFMTIQLADGRKTFLDFRERAPLAATANMYLDSSGNVIKGASTKGHLAVGVPGSVAGLEYAREKYGTRSRGALIAPAIGFAERGFVLDDGDIALFATANDDFKDNLNPLGRMYYSFSTLLCTPCSRSQEVGLCLGAQAGEARMREVVTSAGFGRFRRAT